MKILLTGASGFIGSHILARLEQEGYDITVALHTPNTNLDIPFIICDFTKEFDIEVWRERVRGFDMVVNSVGIIAEKGAQSFENLHTKAPIALFEACALEGVRRVIQVSALGADEDAQTAYHLSKKEADDRLRSLGVEYFILKPSIVYGEGGKSTALFRALASLPILPIIDNGEQKLQPIYIDDLVATVVQVIESDEVNVELDLVGDKALSYQEMLEKFRAYLGKSPTKTVRIPDTLASLGRLLDEPTISRDNLTMLRQGNYADVYPLQSFLGYMPKSMDETIFAHQATAGEKLHAGLYFIRPLLRWIIGFVWIWSGVVSLFLYPRVEALQLLHDVGIDGAWAVPTLYLASFLDMLIGVLTIVGYRIVALAWLQIVVIAVYTLILSVLAPYHWLHPFGPVLKNLPLLVSIYVLILLEKVK